MSKVIPGLWASALGLGAKPMNITNKKKEPLHAALTKLVLWF